MKNLGLPYELQIKNQEIKMDNNKRSKLREIQWEMADLIDDLQKDVKNGIMG